MAHQSNALHRLLSREVAPDKRVELDRRRRDLDGRVAALVRSLAISLSLPWEDFERQTWRAVCQQLGLPPRLRELRQWRHNWSRLQEPLPSMVPGRDSAVLEGELREFAYWTWYDVETMEWINAGRYEPRPRRRWPPWIVDETVPPVSGPAGPFEARPQEFSGLGLSNPGWLAYGEGIQPPDSAWEAAAELARCGVWDCILRDHFAILIRRPIRVRRDDRGRLHCREGTALAWRDGYRLHAIHGVSVPDWCFERPLEVAAITGMANVETRRALIDLYGRSRFLAECGARVVAQDRDASGMPRRLLAMPEGSIRYVEVVCPSTGHVHLLSVPPSLTSCEEAVAWTFGLQPAEYAPVCEG